MSDTESLLEAAVACHRDGRLAEAAALYEQVLAGEPGNVRANHNLGSICLAHREPGQALPLLIRAFEADPDSDRVWVTYGRGLIAAGDFEAAEALLASRAHRPESSAFELRLRRTWAEALATEGALGEAERQLGRALAIAPTDPEVLARIGRLAFEQARYVEAVAHLTGAVAAAPERPDLLVNLGSAFRVSGDLGAARRNFEKALTLDPDNVTALKNLGNVLLALEQPRAALDLADAWFGRRPSDDAALARGIALRRLGRLAEAAQVFETLTGGEVALDAWNQLGGVYRQLGRSADALTALDQALRLRPDAAEPRFQRAQLRLSAGDFAAGWEDYSARWRSEAILQHSAKNVPAALRARLRLDATILDLTARDVVLMQEQGVGDEIMFASIAAEVAAVARTVTLVCEPRLRRLFQESLPQLTVRSVTERRSPSDDDVVLPIGELGRLFRRRIEDFPGKPYLAPSAAARGRARAWLGASAGALRVGLSWRGGTPATRSLRSMPIETLAPLLFEPNCEFISLQYGDIGLEVEDANRALGVAIRTPPPDLIDDFDDLAGLVAELDVVVSVQTALVHVCGAIGQRCHALIPQVAEWRYMQRGDATPWYGSVRLWRQAEDLGWDPVVRIVAEAVQNEMTARAVR